MHETGTGQHVAQLHERLMMMMMIKIIMTFRRIVPPSSYSSLGLARPVSLWKWRQYITSIRRNTITSLIAKNLPSRFTELNGSRHYFWLSLLVIFSCMQFWIFYCRSTQHWNFATLSKDLLTICLMWLCPNFCWGSTNIHLGFSPFTSRPSSSLVTNKLLLRCSL